MKLKLICAVALAAAMVSVLAAGCLTPNPQQVPITYVTPVPATNQTPTAKPTNHIPNNTIPKGKATPSPTALPTATPTAIPTSLPTATPLPPAKPTAPQVVKVAPKPTTPAKPTGYALEGLSLSPSEMPLQFVTNNSSLAGPVYAAMVTWNNALGKQIFGGITVDPNAKMTGENYDGKNEICIGAVGASNAGDTVADTACWLDGHTIIAIHLTFSNAMPWGNSAPDYVIQNVATHECGHMLGLADLYNPAYSDATMYGMTNPGETNKETLTAGDIYGAELIYG